MWSLESEFSEPSTAPARLLAAALQRRGFFAPVADSPAVSESPVFKGFPEVEAFTSRQQSWVMGQGWLYAELLTLPLPLPSCSTAGVLHCGALMNLIIVLSDRLLDTATNAEALLPTAQIAQCGGSGSIVTVLLSRFRSNLDALEISPSRYLPMVRRTLQPFFAAQRRTLTDGPQLPFRFWLRKCTLPWLALALPALCISPLPSQAAWNYTRWLYRFGSFLGMVDDAADWDADLRNGEPNWWRHATDHIATAERAAVYGITVLSGWDWLCRDRPTAPASRNFFTGSVARWLRC